MIRDEFAEFPTVYKFKDNVLTEEEALSVICENLGQTCGDISLDLRLIEKKDRLASPCGFGFKQLKNHLQEELNNDR